MCVLVYCYHSVITETMHMKQNVTKFNIVTVNKYEIIFVIKVFKSVDSIQKHGLDISQIKGHWT